MKQLESSIRSGKAACSVSRGCHHLLVFLLSLSLAGNVGAAEVDAGYIQAQGTQLALQISVGAPAPSSLILLQKLPPGVRVLAAQPPADNVNPGRGEAKWLLRNISPGNFTVRITLDRPVAPGDISAEIRFMPAQSGEMRILPVVRP